MTNAQIKLNVSQLIGIARSGNDSTEEWQAVQDRVNDGIVDILSRTRIYVRTVTLTLTAGEDEYDFGPAVLQIHNLRKIRSDGTAGDELEELSPGDITNAGTGFYALMGLNRIALGWLPSGTGTALQLKAWYTPKPTPMSLDADDPSVSTFGGIPAQYHDDAVVNYGAWKMGLYARDPDSQMGERFRVAYEGADGMGGPGSDLGRIKADINKRGGSGSQRSRMRRMGERTISDLIPNYWQG